MYANQLSEAPLDLRAPVFTQIRKDSGWLRLITLVAVDFTLLFLAWVLAEYYSIVLFNQNLPRDYFLIILSISIKIGAISLQGLYQAGKKRSNYFNIIKTLTFAQGLVVLILLLYKLEVDVTRTTLILHWLLDIAFICAGRLALNHILEYLRRKKVLGHHSVFIVCEAEEEKQVSELVQKENRYIIQGISNAKSLDKYYRQKTLEKINQLGVTEAFISWDAIKNRMFLCWLFQAVGITVHILPMQLKPIYREIELTKIGGMPCLSFYCPLITGKDFWLKRTFDFCFSTLFLIITSPIYLAIALLIKIDSTGNIFYSQTRVGLHGQLFKAWKFRTMKPNADRLQKELEALNETKDGILFKIKDDPRITKIGKFLRRYSLDELPQIFNVLLGEMSLIGPRPLPTRDVDKFSERHFLRHEVLPGITGLWQVSGRSDIMDFEQVITLDLRYIENWSLWLDLQILFQTIGVVLNKKGAY